MQSPQIALTATPITELAHGAENATWRSFYLSAAADLDAETRPTVQGQSKQGTIGNGLKPMQSVERWFDLLAVRLNGPRSGDKCFAIDIHVQDVQQWWRVNVSNGALTYRAISPEWFSGVSGLTLILHKKELFDILSGAPLHVHFNGDASLVG